MKKKAKKKKPLKKKEIPVALKQFGQRLQELRKAQGYSSQEGFAYDHEFSRIQYNKWERGSDIKLSSLIRLAKAFDMTLQEFLGKDIG